MKNMAIDLKTLFYSTPIKVPISESEVIFQDRLKTKLSSEILEARRHSQFSDYKPKIAQQALPEEFQKWKELYLKSPKKGEIRSWTKHEKEYYEKIPSKDGRKQYLIKRSGIIPAILDLPHAFEQESDKEELRAKILCFQGIGNSVIENNEWRIVAGILGDTKAFLECERTTFTARRYASLFLAAQLGEVRALSKLRDLSFVDGVYNDITRQAVFDSIVLDPPLDRFGMLPYLDEILGYDWVMDFSEVDYFGNILLELDRQIKTKELVDPRSKDIDSQDRQKFYKRLSFLRQRSAVLLEDKILQCDYNMDVFYLESMYWKVRFATPPCGYTNAPLFFFGDDLEEKFAQNQLDWKLNPLVPASSFVENGINAFF